MIGGECDCSASFKVFYVKLEKPDNFVAVGGRKNCNYFHIGFLWSSMCPFLLRLSPIQFQPGRGSNFSSIYL
ncbi:hypothetical protein Ahy_A01g000697 isoform A [Arachis hypogaea]|uniref:Uncharacterized protein n=1 Tax=Arachis hypogaea TaxID=3818 RepID=A0A445EL64_ARAHY|nr:hypothetical protein Ahy_A01g000697 isoform A [Arachis hypogaea]